MKKIKECPFKYERAQIVGLDNNLCHIYQHYDSCKLMANDSTNFCVCETNCPIFKAGLHVPSLTRDEFKKYFGDK